jgi:hypothetical protein
MPVGTGPTPDNPENTYSNQMMVLDTKRWCQSARIWLGVCHGAGVSARAVSRPHAPGPPVVRRLTVRLLTPRGGSVPSARGYHSLVALGSSLVLFGGKDGATLSSQPLAVFDCPKRKWSYPGAAWAQRKRSSFLGC